MIVSKEIVITWFMRIEEGHNIVNMVLIVNIDFVSKSNRVRCRAPKSQSTITSNNLVIIILCRWLFLININWCLRKSIQTYLDPKSQTLFAMEGFTVYMGVTPVICHLTLKPDQEKQGKKRKKKKPVGEPWWGTISPWVGAIDTTHPENIGIHIKSSNMSTFIIRKEGITGSGKKFKLLRRIFWGYGVLGHSTFRCWWALSKISMTWGKLDRLWL